MRWKESTSWSDAFGVDEALGLTAPDSGTAYAHALVKRAAAGPALLSLGSDDGVRVWVNGKHVHEHRGARPLVFDEDRVSVELAAGENTVLVKIEQRRGPWSFALRVLEPGSVLAPVRSRSGPAVVDEESSADVARPPHGRGPARARRRGRDGRGGRPRGDDRGQRPGAPRPDAHPRRQRVAGRAVRGALHHDDGHREDVGDRTCRGGRATPVPRRPRVVEKAKGVDVKTPAGKTRRMLADLVLDRTGGDVAKAGPEALRRTHAAVFESAELDLEAAGKTGRVHGHGFVRLAWVDEVDGSVQFCRAYLPAGYRADQRWPLVVQLHGYNPANPEYVRWWAVDNRHHPIHSVDRGPDGPVYIEPHGRGNTSYRGFGEYDVLRAIAEAKKALAIDEDRVALMGDSMGGWGTWQVATRHPEVFAAIAPVFGGPTTASSWTRPSSRS